MGVAKSKYASFMLQVPWRLRDLGRSTEQGRDMKDLYLRRAGGSCQAF